MRSEGVLQKFSSQILQQVPFKVLQAQVCVGLSPTCRKLSWLQHMCMLLFRLILILISHLHPHFQFSFLLLRPQLSYLLSSAQSSFLNPFVLTR